MGIVVRCVVCVVVVKEISNKPRKNETQRQNEGKEKAERDRPGQRRGDYQLQTRHAPPG